MNNFNIKDKVRFKKLSIQEFKELYYTINYFLLRSYDNYLDFYYKNYNKIFEIKKIDDHLIYCKDCSIPFFKEELEKVSYLKTKFKIVNKILNNKK